MADINEENIVSGVYGGVTTDNCENRATNLPMETGFWTKVKSFLFQEVDLNKEIVVTLTPAQQKVEEEINEFLHQEITWEKVHDFLFQEVKFGKNKVD